MTDVITKVAIGWVEYPFAGWGSEWQEVVYLTQAEYDVLPASKLTDGKIYKIKTSGVAPTPGGGDSFSYEDPTCYAGEEITHKPLTAEMVKSLPIDVFRDVQAAALAAFKNDTTASVEVASSKKKEENPAWH